MEKGKELRIEHDANTINIIKSDYSEFFIHLNDKIMNLSKPITVIQDGKIIFKGKVKRKKEHIDASISKRMDPEYIFSAKLKIAAGKVCAE